MKNLITENIKITKELIDFHLENGLFINLKTGEYHCDKIERTRTKYNKELISQISELYINRELYPTKYYKTLGFPDIHKFQHAMKGVLKERYRNARDLYQLEIRKSVEATNLEKFGAKCNFSCKETRDKIRATNIEKYGAANPMLSAAIQEKARETNQKRYGGNGPMSSVTVREKARKTNLEKYGVENPSQTPEIRRKQVESLFSNYGVYHPLESPLIVQRARETCMLKYGVEHPMRHPDVLDKVDTTHKSRYGAKRASMTDEVKLAVAEKFIQQYGVDHPSQLPEIKQKIAATNLERYGFSYPTKSPEIMEKLQSTNLERYGVKCSLSSDRVRQRVVETNLERYGVENPQSNAEIRIKTESTNLARYGSKSPFGSPDIKYKISKANLEKYGVTCAMKVPEIINKALEARHIGYGGRYGELANLKEISSYRPLNEQEIEKFFNLRYCKSQELVYAKELGIKEPTKYTTELKLASLLDSLNVKYIKNAKKIHGVKFNEGYHDLDAYLPDYNLGIEINGLAYHSTNVAAKGKPKSKDYHFNKFISFYNKGIKLLSFTDYEQQHFSADVQNIVEFHLGLSDTNTLNPSKEFLEFNGIQDISESLNYGCFDPEKLSDFALFDAHKHQRFIDGFEYWDCGVVSS